MARRDDDGDDFDFDDDRSKSVKKKKRRSSSNPFIDFLMFRLFVSPWIAMIVFWLAVLGTLGFGAFSAVMALIYGPNATFKILGALYGLGMMVLGPIYARLVAEMFTVMFRIFDTLVEIKNALED